MLELALRLSRFNVLVAANGQQAVEIYRTGAVDAVLMDERMPVMDGPQSLAALQKIDANVRCFFMSGASGQYSDDDLSRMGAVAVCENLSAWTL